MFVQIKLWHDVVAEQLHVTIIRALNLPKREAGVLRNPYLKIHLLPGELSDCPWPEMKLRVGVAVQRECV